MHGAHLQDIEDPLWKFPLTVSGLSESDGSPCGADGLCIFIIRPEAQGDARMGMACPLVD